VLIPGPCARPLLHASHALLSPIPSPAGMANEYGDLENEIAGYNDEEEEENYDDEDFEEYEDDDDFEDYDEEEEAAAAAAVAPPPKPPAIPQGRPPLAQQTQQQHNQMTMSRSPSPPVRKDPMSALADAINAENQAVQYRGGSRSGTPSTGLRSTSYGSLAQRGASPEPIAAPAGRVAVSGNILSERAGISIPVGLSDAARKAASQRGARWKSLMREVRLSETRLDDMFVLEPLTMTQLWSLGRGPYSTMSVKSTQTADDVRTFETQTDEVEVRGVSAQAPEDLGVSRTKLEAEAQGKRRSKVSSLVKDDAAQALQGSKERRLANFICRSGAVMDSLLGERSKAGAGHIFTATAGSAASVSASSLTLDHRELVEGRECVGVAYADEGGESVLTAYSLPEGSRGYGAVRAHGLEGMGLCLAWDMSSPSGPSHVLVSEGAVACCCMGPGKSQLAFAGMEDGGICVWDLREPGSMHKPLQAAGGAVHLTRRPTYSTEYSAAADQVGGIVRLEVSSRAALDSQEHARSSFQLLSLDGWGRVTVWMVSDMSLVDVAGAQKDYGLRIGGRVKLLRTADALQVGPVSRGQRRLQTALRELETAATVGEARGDELDRLRERVAACRLQVDEEAVRSFDLRLLPGDSSQFAVAADLGKVLRGARYGSAPPPRAYVMDEKHAYHQAEGGLSADATRCLGFCPHPGFQHLFAAGYGSGTVAVFDVARALPVLLFRDTSPAAIMAVLWSPARPAMFFAVDARSTLYAWDLAQPNGALGPVHAESFGAAEGPTRVTSAEASRPYPGGQASLALGYEGGLVALHLLSASCTTPVEGEEATVAAILGKGAGEPVAGA